MVKSLREVLDSRYVCDRCIGRLFAQLLTSTNNLVRGNAIKTFLAMEIDAKESKIKGCSYNNINFRNVKVSCNEERECDICGGVFNNIDDYASRIKKILEGYEFKTLLIGVVPSNEMLRNEEELWEKVGVEYAEPIKEELSREIGKAVLKIIPDKEIDFSKPDVTVIVDFQKNAITKKVRSLYIYGRYNKYKEMPQTTWLCNYCHGTGCDKCNFTGKKYEESVQDLIGNVLLEYTKGIGTKFHGSGREDIDALCYGWREFIIEVKEPKVRNLDLKVVEKEINKRNKGKVEVKDLMIVEKDKVREIKNKRQNKTYEATIECEQNITSSDAKRVEDTFNEKVIAQQTPLRVKHRRADLVRERKIFYIKFLEIDGKKAKIEVKTEAGTYIKELVSGDEGRTRPSISSLLQNKCKVIKLIVKGFEDA